MPHFTFDDIAEPPPPRRGRRVLVVTLVLVVLAGVGVGVAAWVNRSPTEPDRRVAAGRASTAPGPPAPTTTASATPPPTGPVSGVLFGDPDTATSASPRRVAPTHGR